MTLHTRFRITDPVNAREAFDHARTLIGAQHAVEEPYGYGPNPGWANVPGQGYVAIVDCQYGPDGPLVHEVDDDAPEAFVEVSFDTAYGYRAYNGASCEALHAWLIREMGRWCDERRAGWTWQNEFTGDWNGPHGTPLGDPDRGRPTDRELVP